MSNVISFKKKPAGAAPAAAPAPVVPAQAAPAPAPAPVQPAPAPAPAPVQPAPAPAPSTAIVGTAGNAQVVPADYYRGVGRFEGEFTARDMATPYLAIMQKQSKNFDDHVDWLGQWVYDKEILLGAAVKVVVVRVTKSYIQRLEFGSEEIPQRFARMADVRAAGLNDAEVQEVADIDVLIELDATLDGILDLATIIEGDKAYIPARYTVRSTAYGRTVGILAKDSNTFLKGNLINGFYVFETEKRVMKDMSWYIPVLKTAGPTPQALRDKIIDVCAMPAVS